MAETPTPYSNGRKIKLDRAIVTGAIAVIGFFLTWHFTEIMSLRDRMTRTEQNRYTSKDAAEDWHDEQERHEELRDWIDQRFRTEVPPQEVKLQLDWLKREIEALKKR